MRFLIAREATTYITSYTIAIRIMHHVSDVQKFNGPIFFIAAYYCATKLPSEQ